MAFVREKEINGNKYLYLVESVRDGDSVRQKVLKYLGPRHRLSEDDMKKAKEKHGD